MQLGTLAIVGVGLIGGSIGLAVKERKLAQRVVGVGRRRESLDLARRLGAIDHGSLQIPDAVSTADLIVLCTPVQRIAEQALEVARCCKAGALVTDAGSTKEAIVAAVDGRLPEHVRFVGSHPLAGSEKRGPEHADAHLFLDRLTIVTPGPHTNPNAVEHIGSFWKALGSRVKIMSPAEHDEALALTSHVPHLIASALAGLLPEKLFELTATGFRDTTRIAAGEPDLWTGIFLQNRREVLAALDRVGHRVDQFRKALEARDEAALNQFLEQAKRTRDALGS